MNLAKDIAETLREERRARAFLIEKMTGKKPRHRVVKAVTERLDFLTADEAIARARRLGMDEGNTSS